MSSARESYEEASQRLKATQVRWRLSGERNEEVDEDEKIDGGEMSNGSPALASRPKHGTTVGTGPEFLLPFPINTDATTAEKTNSSKKMSQANTLQHRGGMDFFALARGNERSYSTSFLINLDPDIFTLCATADQSAFDLSLAAVAAHTKRIFRLIQTKAKRDIDQFCFGSTHVQLNPNYRKFERMDPMTWKKEGIASHWTGARGYRKKCCKNCCTDITCNGCGVCKGCINSPIRGNYDGMVILTAVTRETLPNYSNIITASNLHARRQQEKLLDHGQYAMNLEFGLTSHFMYASDLPELQSKCVPSSRMSFSAGEAMDEANRLRQKKYTGYAVYVAYRLEPSHAYNHNAKMSRIVMDQQPATNAGQEAASNNQDENAQDEDGMQQQSPFKSRTSSASFKGFGNGTGAYDIEDIDDFEFGRGAPEEPSFRGFGDEPLEGEDIKLIEDLEDKQLQERIASLEADQSNIKEQVQKIDHGRNWMEERLTALEADITALTEKIQASS